MSYHSYWSTTLSRRVSRRRALAGTVAASGAAAFLAACGGGTKEDDADSITSRDKSGLLSEPQDTSAQARRGGVFQHYRTDDATTLDVLVNNSSLSWPDMLQVYSHLTKAGLRSNSPDAFEPDAASKWEISPDGLQVTFQLRDNMKFDPRPPTSGRVMNSADVKWSFEKFGELSPYRSEVFNSLSPAAPVQAIQTPDEKTVVLKLAFPYASIIEMVGFGYYLYIEPTEADGKFNAKSEMRGSGPFRLTNYTPSVALEYTRNTDWYQKDRPFLDGIRRAIIPDYSGGLAQFEAGALWYFMVRQEDILRTKRAHPELVMYQERDVGVESLASTPYIALSQRPDSVLRDIRLRRAASMMIDRELYIQTFYNTESFAKEGLPIDTLWNAHLPTGAPNWIDPRDSAIGEGGQYFQHNPAEALKLIQATGLKNLTFDYFYQNRGGDQARNNEVLSAMLSENGAFAVNASTLDYNTEWREVCQRSAGEAYTGFCYNNSGGFNEDAYLISKYTVGGKYAVSYQPIPGISDAVLAQRKEADPAKRATMIKDIQRKLAMEMHDIPLPGRAYRFNLRQPWLKNYEVFVTGGDSSLECTDWWYDESAKNS